MAWNKNLIAEGVLAPDLNDEIRANWAALETVLGKEMNFSTGGEASLQGILKQGNARMFSQASAPATRVDGSAFASTDLGSIWIKTGTNKIYTLTAIGPVVWTLISTEIIALLVSQINTWALAQTLSVSPVFTKGIVANATYLKGRNEADDANTDMIQVGRNEADNTDVVQLPDKARLASNAAPTEDTQLVIKKYADDLVGTKNMTPTTESGGTSSTGVTVFENGFRIARGQEEVSAGAADTITPSGFTKIYHAGATVIENNNSDRQPAKIGLIADTTFTIRNTNNDTVTYSWFCIGR